MGRTIRKMSRKGYAKVAKPFLFRRQPDAAHQSMLWTARALHAMVGATRTLASSRLFLASILLIPSVYLLGWIKILIYPPWQRKLVAALRLVAQ